MLAQLKKEYDFKLIEKDIDESDELTEKYGLMIPVVEIDGHEVQFGHIDPITVGEALTEKTEFYQLISILTLAIMKEKQG